MIRQNELLWETLRRAGVVQGTAPDTGKAGSPWYVKVLLAFSGWLAALFLLGFIGAGFVFIFNNSTAALIIGGLMMGSAFAVLRIPGNEFVEHLGLAVSLAGQVLVIYAFFDISDQDGKIVSLLVLLLQAPLAVFMPSFVHRVFSAFTGAFAFSMALGFFGCPYFADGIIMFLTSWCWLNEFCYIRHMKTIQSIGYGLVLALIQMKGSALFGYRTLDWIYGHHQPVIWAGPWTGEILTGAAMLYTVWHLLHGYKMAPTERPAIAVLLTTLLLCALSLKVQGITVGMVIILLGFAGSNLVLTGLGIVSLLFYISAYYYLLDITLLEKSGTLLMVGIALILLHRILPVVLPEKKEPAHV